MYLHVTLLTNIIFVYCIHKLQNLSLDHVVEERELDQLLTLRLLMLYIYIYGAPILDVSRSHTTTQHSR